MANALGTLASALIIQRSLEMVFVRYPMLKQLSLDLSDSEVAYNQAITSRYQAVATVNDFGTGATDRADTSVAVTLNNFKEVHHAFTAIELASTTKRNLLDESARPIAEAIGAHILGAVAGNASPVQAGIWTQGNFSNEDTSFGGASYAAAATTYAKVVTQRQALNVAGVPNVGRFMVVNSPIYSSLLTDTNVVQIQNNNRADGTIATGVLSNVAGFDIYEWPNMPSTGASVAGTKVGFCGVGQSTVFAGRVPKDPREVLPGAGFPGNIGIVTDEGSGLSVMVNEWIDPSTLKANVRCIFMYGVAVGHPTCGRVLRSTAI